MSGYSRQVTALRPAAVSIHNDSNMLGQPVRNQIAEQRLFFTRQGFERFRCFHAIIPANSENGLGMRVLFRAQLELIH